MRLFQLTTYLLQPAPPPPSFWETNGTTILVALVTAVLTLLLSEPLTKMLHAVMNWVSESFVALGIGFKKRYTEALARDHRWLKLIGISRNRTTSPPRLKHVFISLRFSSGETEDSASVRWEKLFIPNAPAEQKRVVILGEPGAGKTTLLDYLNLVFCGEIPSAIPSALGNPLPVYVRLREVSKETSLLNLITAPRLMQRSPTGFFDRFLGTGKCVVMLDGLDEVLDDEMHESVSRQIDQVINSYPDNWYIITCRVAGWRGQIKGFRIYEARPFDENDIRGFITAWYREVLRSDELDKIVGSADERTRREIETRALQAANQQADALWDSLRRNSGLMRVARTPLILSLITLVHYARQAELPKGRAMLYQRCLEILLEEWDMAEKRLRLPDAPSLQDKLLTMKTIAFHFQENDILEMNAQGLHTLVEPLLGSLSVKTSAKSLIEHIYQRSGILVETAIGRYGFAHRALQDYLVASHISESFNDALLVKHAGEEPWDEIIRIAIGLVKPAKRAETLLRALLEKNEDRSLTLAGWSLNEDIQIQPGLRQQIVTGLQTRMNTLLAGNLSGEAFSRLTSALISTDQPAFERFLTSALDGQDTALQERVLNLLPELNPQDSPRFVPLLYRLISSQHMAAAPAALALSRLPIVPDAETWQVLAQARAGKQEQLRQAATWAWCEFGRFQELRLVKVPAGEFIMGSNPQTDRFAQDDEQPQHTLYLPTYYIGKTPVTVAQYRTFLQESGYNLKDKNGLSAPANQPITSVTWYDALAYAVHYGMSLPSEAEWEKGARGVDGRIYPWGNQWMNGLANTKESWSGGRGLLARARNLKTSAGPTPVGQFSPGGDSPYGCVDMIGNVWEWTRSERYKPYPYDPTDGREDISRKDAGRGLRGGSFYNDSVGVRCAFRVGNGPGYRGVYHGFRVVVCSPFFSH